jgi:hypothetical protein
MVLNAVADACGIEARLDLALLPGEQIEHSQTIAPPPWQDLLLGRTEAVCRGGGERPAAILSGAFNPLHAGHRRMAELAQAILGVPVALELSILNADKPPLDYAEIERRLQQFPAEQPVWLTRAGTFEEKSRLFPGATFIVGVDTLRRIADPHYYGDDPQQCLSALERIAGRRSGFLVFGRVAGDVLVRLADLDLPQVLRGICTEVREDISSTAIRQSGAS